MPYIQIEILNKYPTEVKRNLAKQIGIIYAELMKADVRRITVSIRELGEGNIWRCAEDEPTPAAIMMCDIRAGRDKDTREKLSKALIEVCNDILQLEVNQLNIEYTQHSGDEMYHQWMGKLSEEWSADEV